MTQSGDKRVPPDIPALLHILVEHEVDFVLAGSVAVEAWGVDVGVPGDLDIVPSTDPANLERLADVLRGVEARSWPVTGRWVPGDGNEVRWEEYADDDPRRGMPLPDFDPSDVSTFDSLFSTIHGELDIVPRISGAYDELIDRATTMTVHGVDNVPVASIEDLLAYLTVPRRKKDASRLAVLRARQRERTRRDRM